MAKLLRRLSYLLQFTYLSFVQRTVYFITPHSLLPGYAPFHPFVAIHCFMLWHTSPFSLSWLKCAHIICKPSRQYSLGSITLHCVVTQSVLFSPHADIIGRAFATSICVQGLTWHKPTPI